LCDGQRATVLQLPPGGSQFRFGYRSPPTVQAHLGA
jgi:hypothetical protein